MSSNSIVELIKIPAPKGYNAKHVWAIVKDGKQYGEIVPDMGKNGTIGYTVYTAAGVEHYSLLAGGPSHSGLTLAAALSVCKQVARNMVRREEEAAAAKVAEPEPAAPVAAPEAPAAEAAAAPALEAFDPAAPTATKYAAESLCRFAVSCGCLLSLCNRQHGVMVKPTTDVALVLAVLEGANEICLLHIKRRNPQSAMLSGLDNAGVAWVLPICEYDVCNDETVPDHTDAPLIEAWAEAFARRTYN